MPRGSHRWLALGTIGLFVLLGMLGFGLGRILPPQLGSVSSAVAVAVLFALLWPLWQLPRWYTAPMRKQLTDTPASELSVKDRLALEKDLLQSEWAARGTIAQAVGGMVLLIGVFFTWANLNVASEGQITDRFTRAVDQLATSENGTPKLESRVGGIYALERIAQDSPARDHWTITEVLTTYVRRNTPPSAEPEEPQVRPAARTDIQAALTVLGRRARQHDRGHLDLRATKLRWADLRNALLQKADLRNAQIQAALLEGAQLQGANLEGAQGADPANPRGINSARIDETTILPAYLVRAPDGKIIPAP